MTSEHKKKSLLEKVFGNPITQGITTSLAALSPIAGLLPILTNTLAFGRYSKRIESTLTQFQETLSEHQQKLDSLNDAQFKLINETISTVLNTLEEDKLGYLRTVVYNTLDRQDLEHHEVALLSRVIRDLSAQEAQFLLDAAYGNEPFEKVQIWISPKEQSESMRKEKTLWLYSDRSEDFIMVTGLINLGLLVPTGNGLGGTLAYTFSPVAKSLRELLKQKKSHDLEKS